ncbi:MAG: prepilin-type N-terminal cleavage/methylation domain-containing protein [Pseudomonadales bacterium]|nr:prepilin-type N-terminal cleavage/methylation domain-containing protein [Pseudomonadales bacterium]MBO7006550.1 prepilin-type N-terminal cleavage/methylation domain-containing protein [Pseudomonadales bacterium]
MKTNQLGFTLLEAMVAIVILSMSLFATYSWINVSIQTLQRSSEVLTEEVLINEVLDRLVIHGDQDVGGRLYKGDQSLEWEKILVEKKQGKNNIGSTSFHDHTLYDIKITLKKDQRKTVVHQTRLVESVQVREPAEALFL